ncbi:MAG: plasmid stabilization protein [Coleofasciculaceae cyanobacterium SM2_1_6]|nr:plasmid stabilization protein [Coleofasciculaceae cyanobacterium SM2_1_6]
MANTDSLTIENLDDALKAKLQVRAVRAGRSIEEEARIILKTVLEENPSQNLAETIHQRFVGLGGFDLPPIDRAEGDAQSLFEDL